MGKTRVMTKGAPGAVGPYSQGIRTGNLVFTSGQLPMPAGGQLETEDIAKAARYCLENVKAVLEAGGASMADVIKVTVFLTDMGDFGAVNEVYGEYFPEPYPARSCIEVAGLPLAARIEIEAIAAIGNE